MSSPPGSVRRVEGRRRYYRRISPAGTPPAPAPGWLLDALSPPAPLPVSRPELPRCPDAYARAALRAESEQVRRAAAGTRNTAVFGAGRRLGQLAAAGLLDEHDAITALTRASAGHLGVHGFTAAEAATTIANGLRYGRRRPRQR